MTETLPAHSMNHKEIKGVIEFGLHDPLQVTNKRHPSSAFLFNFLRLGLFRVPWILGPWSALTSPSSAMATGVTFTYSGYVVRNLAPAVSLRANNCRPSQECCIISCLFGSTKPDFPDPSLTRRGRPRASAAAAAYGNLAGGIMGGGCGNPILIGML